MKTRVRVAAEKIEKSVLNFKLKFVNDKKTRQIINIFIKSLRPVVISVEITMKNKLNIINLFSENSFLGCSTKKTKKIVNKTLGKWI